MAKAANYLHQAGQEAYWLSAYQVAIDCFGRGLALLSDMPAGPDDPQVESQLMTGFIGQNTWMTAQIRKAWTLWFLGFPDQSLAILKKTLGQILDEATGLVEETGERFFEAELNRLRGEFLWQRGSDPAQVEVCCGQALDIARRQEAKSLELRAAMSLARLWKRQGRAQEAQTLLAEL